MDFRQVVAGDEDLRSEILERRDELVAAGSSVRGGLEGLDDAGGGGTEGWSGVLRGMSEGTYVPGEARGLEAIVLRFARPVFLVQDSVVTPPTDSAASFGGGESVVISSRLEGAKRQIDRAIPSVGRIDLVNHRQAWVGTAWMVDQEVAVTNRHVAEQFARPGAEGFSFRTADGTGRLVRASIDWRREHGRAHEAVVRVDEVLWIEPDGGPDLALVRVRPTEDGQVPAPIPLMARADVEASVGTWVAVIGYPARSAYNDLQDQQRIFDGIYEVKRLAPGTVTGITPEGQLTHDATTLGGNSGSVVVDLATGLAVGLHHGGLEGDRNMAVQAPVVADRIAALT